MDTYFAPAPRSEPKKIKIQIDNLSHNPIVDTLLKTIPSLMVILNDDRQIISINHLFLEQMGISRPEEALGLRLGESLHCVHAQEQPNGCGTTKACGSCGAAIATIAAIEGNIMQEKICALTAERYGTIDTISLLVKAQPVMIGNERFILVSAQDITQLELWSNLERVFFHDINNILNGLLGYSELLALDFPDNEKVRMVRESALRIHKEISIQRVMSVQKNSNYTLMKANCTIKNIRKDLVVIISNHRAHKDKNLRESWPDGNVCINTDILLLTRVLSNMIINALEATEPGGEVTVTAKLDGSYCKWSIWNVSFIAPENQERIFQKHFSTKGSSGHGFGTYAMKLFGEDYLNGEVGFTSSEAEGTTFTFTLPLMADDRPADSGSPQN